MNIITQLYDCFNCLHCFDAVGWAAGRASGLQKLSGGVLVWFSEARCRLAYSPADATATVSCSRLVLPFWYWHTWVVPENTHTLSTSSIYNDPWHPLCSVYELDSPHVQPLQVLFGLLVPSTSYSIHFFTQPSSFRSTCPYQRSLFYCNTNAVTQSLS